MTLINVDSKPKSKKESTLKLVSSPKDEKKTIIAEKKVDDKKTIKIEVVEEEEEKPKVTPT
jgi:hypothetical protein